MRVLEYTGKPERIGRFGRVETGQLLELTEQEAGEALRHPTYRLVDRSGVDTPDGELPEPRKTDHYDLTRIDWANQRLHTILSRESRPSLWRIAKAMEEVTGGNIPYGPREQPAVTIDSICEVAREMNWTFSQSPTLQQ
jgi:hypothetical protein